jgi:hypothetical protein
VGADPLAPHGSVDEQASQVGVTVPAGADGHADDGTTPAGGDGDRLVGHPSRSCRGLVVLLGHRCPPLGVTGEPTTHLQLELEPTTGDDGRTAEAGLEERAPAPHAVVVALLPEQCHVAEGDRHDVVGERGGGGDDPVLSTAVDHRDVGDEGPGERTDQRTGEDPGPQVLDR